MSFPFSVQKFITLQCNNKTPFIVIFPGSFAHKDVADQINATPIAGGFIKIENDKMQPYFCSKILNVCASNADSIDSIELQGAIMTKPNSIFLSNDMTQAIDAHKGELQTSFLARIDYDCMTINMSGMGAPTASESFHIKIDPKFR